LPHKILDMNPTSFVSGIALSHVYELIKNEKQHEPQS